MFYEESEEEKVYRPENSLWREASIARLEACFGLRWRIKNSNHYIIKKEKMIERYGKELWLSNVISNFK